jgi:hypothetical protein
MIAYLNHDDLVNLVCGLPAPNGVTAPNYVYFSGDQWNASWDWDRYKLDLLSDDELYQLYVEYKGE